MIIKRGKFRRLSAVIQTAGQPKTGNCVCRKIKCRKIISDQCVDEQKVVSKDICTTGKDTDH